MAHMLSLHLMAPGTSLEGIALTKQVLPNSEIAQHIKDTMEPPWDDVCAILDFIYPVSGHPPMRLEPGFVQFVSLPLSSLFSSD